MRYPALIISKEKLAHNVAAVRSLCQKNGVDFCAVTKCFCADKKITQIYYEQGVRDFADTRIANLKQINYQGAVRWLLRAPQPCEAADAVKYSDISLNSEITTITALSRHALKQGKKHKVVLMVDLGDLREGVMPQNALSLAAQTLKLSGVTLYGVGANLNCFGGVIPTEKNLAVLTGIAKEITDTFNVKLSVISGGNSGSIYLLNNKKMPKGINHLRIGESILFGNETSFRQNLAGMYGDVFRLDAQIIELQKKPSKPIGTTGTNAFGDVLEFADKGEMLRAIVAIGKQDADASKLTPVDKKIEILGQSSDHTILNVTASPKSYKTGDIISFTPSYASLLSLCTSKYVNKAIKK